MAAVTPWVPLIADLIIAGTGADDAAVLTVTSVEPMSGIRQTLSSGFAEEPVADLLLAIGLSEAPRMPVAVLLDQGPHHHGLGAPITKDDRVSGFVVAYRATPWEDQHRAEQVMASAARAVEVLLQKRVEIFETLQAQKLESIASLAGGLAHEVNTPAQVVASNIGFLRESYEQLLEMASDDGSGDLEFLQDEVPAALDDAEAATARITSIVRSMKAFGSPETSGHGVDINDSLRHTLVIAANDLRDVAELDVRYDDVPRVQGSTGDMNQVVLNLVLNAAHAVGAIHASQGIKGRVTVRTRLIEGLVHVVVKDTGPGIPPEIQQRIFDPFFTTKEVGSGTGQGLALSKTLVERAGGSITFETGLRGTSFCLRLLPL